jgi:hypothetical protein
LALIFRLSRRNVVNSINVNDTIGETVDSVDAKTPVTV